MTPRGTRYLVAICALWLAAFGWMHVQKRGTAARIALELEQDDASLTELRRANRELQRSVRTVRAGTDAGPAVDGSTGEGVAVRDGPPKAELKLPAAAPNPTTRAARNKALLALIRSGDLGQVSYPTPSPFKVDTKVEKLSELLGLSPEEKDRLDTATGAVLNQLRASAQIQVLGDVVSIEMKDSPAARAEFARMRTSFREVLGEDGHAIYEIAGFRTVLENALTNNGLVPFSVVLQKNPDLNGDGRVYSMARSGATVRNIPQGTPVAGLVAPETDEEARTVAAARAKGPGVGLGNARGATRETIARFMGPLDNLLPPGF